MRLGENQEYASAHTAGPEIKDLVVGRGILAPTTIQAWNKVDFIDFIKNKPYEEVQAHFAEGRK